jgi:signal transduction histidine kinase
MKISSLILFLLIFPGILKASSIVDSLEQELMVSTGEQKVRTLFSLGKYYSNFNNSQSIDYYCSAAEESRKLKNQYLEATSLVFLGVRLGVTGNLQNALDTLEKASLIFKSLGKNEEYGFALSQIGSIYSYAGKLDKAVEMFVECLKNYNEPMVDIYLSNPDSFSEKDKDTLNKTINKLLTIYNDFGLIYQKLGDYTNALKYFDKSLNISLRTGNKSMVAAVYSNIGMVLKDLKEVDKALEYYYKGLAIAKEINHRDFYARMITNIGNIYADKKVYDTALAYYNESTDIFKEINNLSSLTNSYINIALVYFNQGKYKQSIDYYDKAIEISEKSGFLEKLAASYSGLADIYELKNDFKKALFYSKKFHSIQDSVLNIEKLKQIDELVLSYKIDSKDKEINYLKKENESREKLNSFLYFIIILITLSIIVIFISFWEKRKSNKLLYLANQRLIASEEQLKDLNATKDKFFSIISHDLKNPIGALDSLIHIVLEDYTSMSESDRVEILNEMSNTTKHLYDLLMNLLQWSRIQTGSIPFNPDKCDISLIADNIVTLLQSYAKAKDIDLSHKIPPGTEAFVDANMISTVLRNLTTNAVKFTRENGQIELLSAQKEGFIEIFVRDTGIGMSQETIDKLFKIEENFSTEGTAAEKGTGLGLILCKEFIEKHGGNIRVESSEGKGTTFIITIPTKKIEIQ